MLLAAAVRKNIQLCDAVRENFPLPALPCAQGSAGSEEFSRTASHSIIFWRTAAASNIFSRCANKCKKRSPNATKCEKSCLVQFQAKMMPLTENIIDKSKGRKGKLSFCKS